MSVSNNNRRTEIDQLLEQIDEGSLTPEQDARLMQLVGEDLQLRRYYLQQVFLLGQLRRICDTSLKNSAIDSTLDKPTTPQTRRAKGSHWFQRRPAQLSIVVSALSICLLITVMAFMAPPFYETIGRFDSVGPSSQPVVAELSGFQDVVWAEGQAAPSDNAHLGAGRRLVLDAGLAEVTFRSGAVVLLEGPCEFTLSDSNAGALRHGKLAARVSKDARGFTISTPAGEIVDLGTEFVVQSDQSGNVDVGVHVGKVEVRTREAGSVKTVSAGEWASLQVHQIKVSTGSISDRFVRGLPGNQVGTLVVDDPVDDDGSWSLTGSGVFDSSGYGQITPAVRVGEETLALISHDDDGGAKTFGDLTLKAGTYRVAIRMGNYTSAQFPPLMTAELRTDESRIDDLMVASRSPTPSSGGWAQWLMTYVVPPDDVRIGQSLRFQVQDGGGEGNAAFDGLRIWHAPFANSRSAEGEKNLDQSPLE